jgi:hypothetical protein
MAYTFQTEGNNVAVFESGSRIATTTPQLAQQKYGYNNGSQGTSYVQTTPSGAATPGSGQSISYGAVNTTPQAPVYVPPTATAAPGYGAAAPTPIADQHTNLSTSLTAAGATPAQASQLAGAVVTPTNNLYAKAANYSGPSITQFLDMAGQPSDRASRSALAKTYGIANYTGTADQNTQLLHILQGHNHDVSQTGIPGNAGSVLGVSTSVPKPGSPLDLSSLSSGGLDLSKILGASAASGSNIPTDIAGLLSLYGAQTEASKRVSSDQSALEAAMKSMGGEAADLSSALGAPGGYNENIQHVQDLSLQAAKFKGELDSFDANTASGMANLEDQAIPAGLVQGQQAAFQKQRDLTRMSKAAALASTISLIAAYQGNADTAYKLATQSVELKYAPIQNQIDVLKQQIDDARGDMQREDGVNSKIIGALLDYKSQQLSVAKANDTKLQTIGVQAASGGAPLSLVQAALATGDAIQASSMLSKYLKGPTESVTSGTSSTFTQTQINTGASNAGMPIDQFKSLDSDTQNYFVNTFPSSQLAKDIKSIGQTGGKTKEQIAADIGSSNLSDGVKQAVYKMIGVDPNAAPATGGGNFWGNAFSSAASAIGGFLGI